MTAFLLDVNVLIALIDPSHVHHEVVHGWFSKAAHKRFATCPVTENGLIRIVGHPKYPNSPGPPAAVLPALTAIRSLAGHRFWPDDISVADADVVDGAQLTSHSRVTDAYLLALAMKNGGRLATLDRKMATEATGPARAALELL